MRWLSRLLGLDDPRPSVVVDEVGVRRDLGRGKREEITWDELHEVCVVTTSGGPFEEDVYWLLVGADDRGCAVPQSDPASAAILDRVQRLPGFDHRALIMAMGSTDDAQFVCWRGASAAAS